MQGGHVVPWSKGVASIAWAHRASVEARRDKLLLNEGRLLRLLELLAVLHGSLDQLGKQSLDPALVAVG